MTKSSRRWIIWLVVGAAVLGLGTVVPLVLVLKTLWAPARPQEPLPVRLDDRGPYLILATEGAAGDYGKARALARELHPGAIEGTLSIDDLATARALLTRHRPYYALVFLLPEELDVNFAWRWLKLTTELDDDPFVDVRTGFITGASAEAAAALLARIRDVARGHPELPGALVDNLGPNPMARPSTFHKMRGAAMVPVLGERLAISTISHGTQGFTGKRLGSMSDAGLVHFGGHGYPDRIEEGLLGRDVRDLKLAPSVVFNGACYTGVTGRWFDMESGDIEERQVEAGESFCLGLLGSTVVGYLAALHPDHGIPVYQEMEYMATNGASLGQIIKHTHDGVIIGAGGHLPQLPAWHDGMPRPQGSPADIMLKGTAARVLFGDPALILTDAFTEPPLTIALEEAGDRTLKLTASVRNTALKSTFTDTYYADMSATGQFNDRALIVCELPPGWEAVSAVDVVGVQAGRKRLPHRLIGFGLEEDTGRYLLHVQLDLPSTGYMQSAFRQAGSTIEIRVRS